MKIDTTHPDYAAAAPKWKRARDVVNGQDAVHSAGEEYLPRLKDQTNEEYRAYKTRATFFGATKRTAQALHGMIYRKAPTDTAGDSDAAMMLKSDVTLSGVSLVDFAAETTRETLEVGRCGVLVDFPPVGAERVTVAQAQAIGAQPFMVLYKTESILNWRFQRINNRHTLNMVVLSEMRMVQDNEYESSQQQIIRVLILRDGIYMQEVWEKQRDEWTLTETMIPTMSGAALAYIPFQFIGAETCDGCVNEPPLLDLVDLNISHYKSTADVEHGAHFAGLPTAVVSGYQAGENEKLYIGSATAWVFPDPQAKATYLEFTGQGLEALETRIKAKEQQMAVLGARMLAPDKAAAEAAKTMEIRQSGEVSALAALANNVSHGLSNCLKWLVTWAGIGTEAKISLNTDYMVTTLSAQELTALVGAWQSGAISAQVLFYNLKQGEMIEQGIEFEEEQARIGDAQPTLVV
jgi:hypothetical protein